MAHAPFTTVFFVYPDGSQIAVAMPGIPRVGDTVSAQWGTSPTATLYTVTGVVWDQPDAGSRAPGSGREGVSVSAPTSAS